MLTDDFFQSPIKSGARYLVQGQLLVHYPTVFVVKSLDNIDNFFNLFDQMHHCFFRRSYLNGDAVHTRNSTFGGGEGVDIDAPAGKNDGEMTEPETSVKIG